MAPEVSHSAIYERLLAVEKKVDDVHTETRTMVDAFKAVDGAFTVLGWLAKAAKPMLWIGGLITVLGIMYSDLRER
jgi:hypothetical protein